MKKRITKMAIIAVLALLVFDIGCFGVQHAVAASDDAENITNADSQTTQCKPVNEATENQTDINDQETKGFNVEFTDKNTGSVSTKHFDMFLDAWNECNNTIYSKAVINMERGIFVNKNEYGFCVDCPEDANIHEPLNQGWISQNSNTNITLNTNGHVLKCWSPISYAFQMSDKSTLQINGNGQTDFDKNMIDGVHTGEDCHITLNNMNVFRNSILLGAGTGLDISYCNFDYANADKAYNTHMIDAHDVDNIVHVNNSNFANFETNKDGAFVDLNGELVVSASNFKNIHTQGRGGLVYTYPFNIYGQHDNVYDTVSKLNKIKLSCIDVYDVSAVGNGGVFADYCPTDMDRCTFDHCHSEANGGVIYQIDNKYAKKALGGVPYLHMDSCSFTNSWATEDGGSIYLIGEFTTQGNCSMQYCSAGKDGGAVCAKYKTNKQFLVTGTNFNRCVARGGAGGAVCCCRCASFTLCEMTNNLSNKRGSAIFCCTYFAPDECAVSNLDNLNSAVNSANSANTSFEPGLQLRNCTIEDNNSAEYGAVVVDQPIRVAEKVVVKNNTLSGTGVSDVESNIVNVWLDDALFEIDKTSHLSSDSALCFTLVDKKMIICKQKSKADYGDIYNAAAQCMNCDQQEFNIAVVEQKGKVSIKCA